MPSWSKTTNKVIFKAIINIIFQVDTPNQPSTGKYISNIDEQMLDYCWLAPKLGPNSGFEPALIKLIPVTPQWYLSPRARVCKCIEVCTATNNCANPAYSVCPNSIFCVCPPRWTISQGWHTEQLEQDPDLFPNLLLSKITVQTGRGDQILFLSAAVHHNAASKVSYVLLPLVPPLPSLSKQPLLFSPQYFPRHTYWRILVMRPWRL